MLEYISAILDWCKAQIPLWSAHSATVFKEGELWWCQIGMNVGREIYGKGAAFSRPVLVFKKLSADLFLGIPLTSKLKEGKMTSIFSKSSGDSQSSMISVLKNYIPHLTAGRVGKSQR